MDNLDQMVKNLMDDNQWTETKEIGCIYGPKCPRCGLVHLLEVELHQGHVDCGGCGNMFPYRTMLTPMGKAFITPDIS